MGWTPLIIASDNGHLQLCELLLDKGADIDHKHKVSDFLRFDIVLYHNSYCRLQDEFLLII
jgi:ankyrin repeat protein